MGDVCRLVYGLVFVAVAGVFFLTLHLYLAPLLYLYDYGPAISWQGQPCTYLAS
jgi:hypothetical protein